MAASSAPDHDLESIGRNCEYEYCHQLDFLPFRCESCHGTFCLEHRTETAHQCSHAGEWAKRRNQSATTNDNINSHGHSRNTPGASTRAKPNVYTSDQCSHPACKTLIYTLKDPGVHCQHCNRNYCLKHRLREEHDCAKLIPLRGGGTARSGSTQNNNNNSKPQETLRAMFSKVRKSLGGVGGPEGQSQTQTRTQTQSQMQSKTKTGLGVGLSLPISVRSRLNNASSGGRPGSAIAQLNELKKAAKGDGSIPVDKRLYLHVVGTSEAHSKSGSGPGSGNTTEPPSGRFFYDSRWKVGRVLDDAAKRLQMENVNNRVGGEEARLRIFHVESGEFLEFSDAIGAGKVKNGHTIVLLRGAGVALQK